MSDPITSAIAGSVASKAIEGIVDAIESSDNPEETWKRSGLELAIQAQAAYRQGIEAGRLWDLDETQRKMNQFGEMAQQLAIRGELRGFDADFIEYFEGFAEACGFWADCPQDNAKQVWYENANPIIEDIKDQF